MSRRFFMALFLALGFALGGEECLAESFVQTGQMDLSYAEEFSLDYGEGGYCRLTIGEDVFLLVPEGKEPLEEGLTAITYPTGDIYVASSSALDLFLQAGGLGEVTMTSTAAENWAIPEIREAVREDEVLYVGKYGAPDYEVILDMGCALAIENTMIYHVPEAKEQLERLGIPVIVERSSYEPHPLGRVEWIKLYGLLTGHQQEAEAFFEAEKERLSKVEGQEATGKTVAFFYLTSAGLVNVRGKGDYVSKMIELAGGTYFLSDEEGVALNMQMETFYALARDVDVLIYNGTIDGEVSSLEDLIHKNPLLGDFKAVKDGQVWCTGTNMFQQVSGTVGMIADLHAAFAGEDVPLSYLERLS